MDDLNEVSRYLHDLDRDQLRTLGLVLGLCFTTLQQHNQAANTTYLHHLLAAWLRKQDNVMQQCPPTWKNLVESLKSDRLRQNMIAWKIKTEKVDIVQ